MEGETRGEKRKREEEEDSHNVTQQTSDVPNSPKRNKSKREKIRQPRRTKCIQKRKPTQQKAIKPETFETLYSVREKLGEGGFGSVFIGTRLSDGLQVAIKFVSKQEGDRFIKSPKDNSRSIPIEVALMEKMSEPPAANIIQLIQWFDEPERYILVMECPHPSVDLNTLLQNLGGFIGEQLAKYLMLQVVSAAMQCNERGVLHRDIKVENLLLNTETAELKLIDFGCGDVVRKYGYSKFEGTSAFCPPEFLLKGRYHATPITVWSLGITLFELICGFLPFKEVNGIIGGCLHFKDGLSDDVCDLIRWCLQPKPSSRPNLQEILEHKWFQSIFTA